MSWEVEMVLAGWGSCSFDQENSKYVQPIAVWGK
jgi:hypothetical protein